MVDPHSESNARAYIALAAAVIIAAIIVAAAILATPRASTTVTTPATSTTTQTTTLISTGSSSSTETGAVSRLYELEFVQQSACPGGVWLAPWAVTLNNQMIVQPSNATLPLSESGFEAGHSFQNYSTISFSVPDGSYSYAVYPQNFLGQTGNVTVDGGDLVVQVRSAPVACTTTG